MNLDEIQIQINMLRSLIKATEEVLEMSTGNLHTLINNLQEELDEERERNIVAAIPLSRYVPRQ